MGQAPDRLRWLYHVKLAGPLADPYAPPSLAAEGFVHCSFQPDAADSARRYFPAGAELEVLQLDPRLLDAPVEVADTPRGKMPHVHGAISIKAVAARLTLDDVAHAPDKI